MKKIDGKTFKNMIISGANNLQKHKNKVNELNVFPVPDGDTGTNMALTIISVANEVNKLPDSATISEVAKVASNGALRGARGNSGVILSQIFRGLSNGLSDKEDANIQELANAFVEASNSAYKAVMKPKEGTILTIIRVLGEHLNEVADSHSNFEEFLLDGLKHGEEVLKETPEMLAELKQAGVVDAGGKGLLHIIEGFIDGLSKAKVELNVETSQEVSSENIKKIDAVDITNEYCTEFIIERKKEIKYNAKGFNTLLNKLGDSIVLVEDEEVIKVHIHTNNPGKVLEEALLIGRLINIKIENMKEQHEHIIIKEGKQTKPKKEVGFVTVASGEGLESIMLELGCDYVVSGGQSMNPSTADLVGAVENVNAENIIILPNNKNIIMSAKQVSDIIKDKKIYVIETVNIPEGISALLSYNYTSTVEENIDRINASIKKIKAAEVTYAVRNTTVKNKKILENDILGIVQGDIKVVGKQLEKTVLDTVDAMIDDESEVICIYYGEGIDEKDAKAIKEKLEEKYSNCDIDLQYGGQPVYYYIVSVE